LVGKVEEMRRQRAMLAAQLRESTCQDDITHQLVTRTGESLDTIFSQEMQKHQRYVSMKTRILFYPALNVKLKSQLSCAYLILPLTFFTG